MSARERLVFVAPLIALLLTACAAEPELQLTRYPIEDFLGTTNYFGASFSPDKSKLLVSSDETGIYNAYAVPVDGSEPVALTDSTTDSIRAVSYFPTDERFLFLRDEGGNELDHLYVKEEDGSVVDLTPGEGLKAFFRGWSGAKKSFYVGSNEREKSAFDVYRYATDGYERELVYETDGRFFPGYPLPGGGSEDPSQ